MGSPSHVKSIVILPHSVTHRAKVTVDFVNETYRAFTRRSFLTATASGLVLAACSSGDSAPAAEETAEIDPELRLLEFRFPDGLRSPSIFAAGDRLRAPMVLIESDGFPVRANEPQALAVTVSRDGETVFEETISPSRSGLSTPYYLLSFAPEQVGTFVVESDWSPTPREFLVVDPAEVTAARVGQPMPAIDTATVADTKGVNPLCSRIGEPCPFHDITLTEALAGGGPVAFLIATPQFCLTDVCGPSLELMIEAEPDFADITIVHAEVFVDPASNFSDLTEPLTTLGLDFEPSLYLIGSDGIIAEALHFAFDRNEIRAGLQALT